MFLLDCLLKFVLEYTDEKNKYEKIRDISKIGHRYLHSEFIYDFLPLIPFNFMFGFKYSRLLYLIKCMRLLPTLRILETGPFMKKVKEFFQRRLNVICRDPLLADSKVHDNNNIMVIIMIGYVFKTLRLVMIIF